MINKTEITVKTTSIENYEFMVQAIEDGGVTFSRRYGSALEAVRTYMSFTDFGFAKYEREVVLLEPDGQVHSKVFQGPMAKLPVS